LILIFPGVEPQINLQELDMVLSRQSKKLTSSISVLAITISLVAAQSATQKSLAQFATSPIAPPATLLINGAGASSLNTLFVGSGTTCTFGPAGSWFNVVGVGNLPALNANPPTGFTPPCPTLTGNAYGPVIGNDTFRYASVGSGAGVAAFFNPPGSPPVVVPSAPTPANNVNIVGAISFAATDDPLTTAQESLVAAGTASNRTGSGKAIQVPVVGVGITLAFNDPSINQPAAGLKLSRITYCGILNGNITNWNDTRITADNSGVVSTSPIKVVVRQDSSGSTFVLSTHLNTICKTAATPGLPAAYVWTKGAATTIAWPSTFTQITGGGALATYIANNPSTIGYVDNATRLAKPLPAALLQNKSLTAYVGPTTAGIQAALSAGSIVQYGTAPVNRLVRIDNLADPAPATAYPISTASYVLLYDTYTNPAIGCHLKTWLYWALASAPQSTTLLPAQVPAISGGCSNPIASNPSADGIAIARGYAPLPNAIKLQARTTVNNFIP
jgi:phosphate transport system substrate-binding protein